MRTISTLLVAALALWASPAAAQQLQYTTPFSAQPRAIAVVPYTQNRVQFFAVTRRARADTLLRRAHLGESEAMGKIMPGYPQPAFVSVDLRVKF